jgi:hypothetical protein
VVALIVDEPWFTFHTDHDDGIERTELQLALCRLAQVTPFDFEHHDGDGCVDHMRREDEMDAALAAASAAASPVEGCRASGHDFRHPFELRDSCARCGCVRLLRGNPSRFVYEYPETAAGSAPQTGGPGRVAGRSPTGRR